MITRRSAAIVVMDEDGKFLLQHRTDDAPTWAGFWGLFGGGLEDGERPKEALVRELREEIGLDVSEARAVGAIRAARDHVIYVFYLQVEMNPGKLRRLRRAQTEGQGLGFFRASDLPRLKNVVPSDMLAVGHANALRISESMKVWAAKGKARRALRELRSRAR